MCYVQEHILEHPKQLLVVQPVAQLFCSPEFRCLLCLPPPLFWQLRKNNTSSLYANEIKNKCSGYRIYWNPKTNGILKRLKSNNEYFFKNLSQNICLFRILPISGFILKLFLYTDKNNLSFTKWNLMNDFTTELEDWIHFRQDSYQLSTMSVLARIAKRGAYKRA